MTQQTFNLLTRPERVRSIVPPPMLPEDHRRDRRQVERMRAPSYDYQIAAAICGRTANARPH